MHGCVEMLEIDVDGIKTWAHAYVVPDAPYRLLLGRPWQRLVRLERHETDSDVYVTVHDPLDLLKRRTIPTVRRPFPHKERESFVFTSAAVHCPTFSLTLSSLADLQLRQTFDFDPIRRVLAYKKVANKVKPVATTMPWHARIVR